MKNLIKTSFAIFSITLGNGVWALSPPNINTDIDWNTGDVAPYDNGVTDIVSAFNHARRQEEIQLGLATNKLGTLNLPSQANWDKMTDDAKALLIINDERQDRANMLPGVIGLPLTGIESHMDNISKNYGDLLHDTDTIGHSQPSGNPNVDSPFIRIDDDVDIGANCHEFIARGENLAFFATTGNSIPLPLERSIYGFIYDDSDSSWGHREAALLQDITLDNNPWGFSDNHGSAGNEGYLGVYVRSSSDYKPFSSFNSNYGTVVVMNFFDPVNTPACHYNTTLKNTETTSAKGKVPSLTIPDNTWVQIGLNTAAVTGSTVADILGDDISAPYESDWVIFSYQASTNSYQKLSLTDTMLSGIGYWLIQLTGSAITIDMPDSSSGVYVTHTSACPSTEGCFEIPLQSNTSSNQWQMIAYPFRDSRNMNSVKIVTNAGTCSTGCTLSEAFIEGLVADRLWHYENGSYQELSSGGSEKFDPWDGAWVAILPAANGLVPRMLIPTTN